MDAIFDDHLPAKSPAASGRRPPAALLFWAHGGLISEAPGLHDRAPADGVVEEERHLPDPLRVGDGPARRARASCSRRAAAGAPRGVSRDLWTTDRGDRGHRAALGGRKFWAAMKRSAELASDARRRRAPTSRRSCRRFCKAQPGAVELHAVGHSAGAIFHSHFLPDGARSTRTPRIQDAAPAGAGDAPRRRSTIGSAGQIGDGVDHLTVYTMTRRHEEADNCFGLYRKSLALPRFTRASNGRCVRPSSGSNAHCAPIPN